MIRAFATGIAAVDFDVIVIGAGAAGMMCAAQAGQRSGCENINRLLRQHLPKGMYMREVARTESDWIVGQLNRRPRQVLNPEMADQVWRALPAGRSFYRAVALGTRDRPFQACEPCGMAFSSMPCRSAASDGLPRLASLQSAIPCALQRTDFLEWRSAKACDPRPRTRMAAEGRGKR